VTQKVAILSDHSIVSQQSFMIEIG